MAQIFLITLLLIAVYTFVIPVYISFTVDSTLSAAVTIKFYPFSFKIAKRAKKQNQTDIQRKIDYERLLFAEYRTANRIVIILWKFVKAIFKAKHHCFAITLQGGFATPDITGFVYGLIEAIKSAFGNRVTIVHYPDMLSGALNYNLNIQAVVRLHRVLAATMLLMSRLPFAKIVRTTLRIKKGDYNVRPA